MLLNCGTGEYSWESSDSKEIKPVNPKGNEPWVCIGRTDAEADAPILWPLDVKNWLIGKDPDGKFWRLEEKGVAEDEIDSIIDSVERNLGMLQSMGLQRIGHDLVTEQHFSTSLD